LRCEGRRSGRGDIPDDAVRRSVDASIDGLSLAIASLSRCEHAAITLYYGGNLSQAEISTALGISRSTVWRVLNLAKKQLLRGLNRRFFDIK
jgi:RNA polymerase sigma factor (sigma-70 family)